MYRSIANFGIWCTSPESPLPRTATVSTLASSSTTTTLPTTTKITVTGTIPPFQNNLIRQRISTHGLPRPMEPESSLPCLSLPPSQICVIHSSPTKRWLAKKQKWDVKYAKQKRKVQLARGREYVLAQERGFLGGDLRGERPPPSALAGRPSVRMAVKQGKGGEKGKRNFRGWVGGVMGGKEDRKKEVVKVTGQEV